MSRAEQEIVPTTRIRSKEKTMRDFTHVLCPVDFSESSAMALGCGLSIAEHYQAHSCALHIVELWRIPTVLHALTSAVAEHREKLMEIAGQYLQEFVQSRSSAPSGVTRKVSEGVAPDSILDVAREQGADLIVMGAHGRRGLDRLMVGSVAERVIRNANCPVLIVRADPLGGTTSNAPVGSVDLKTILFSTDFSESSLAALGYAISLAEKYEATLTLIHVVSQKAARRSREKAAEDAEQKLGHLVPPGRLGKDRVRLVVRTGKSYMHIIQLAKEIGADLAVMAVRGNHSTDLTVFGSTTHRVIQLGPCPVLVIPG